MKYTYPADAASIKFKSEYIALINARQRCHKESHPQYRNYGARGITVCAEWREPKGFLSFIAHIGLKPDPDLTLERIDNDRGYEVGNVKWATRAEQFANRRPYRKNARLMERDQIISKAFKDGYTVDELVGMFSLSKTIIRDAIGLGYRNPHLQPRNTEICDLRASGSSIPDLAVQFGLSVCAIYKIIREAKQ